MLEIRLKKFANDICHLFIHSLRIPSIMYVIYFRLPYHDSQKMCVSISFWWKWQSLEQEMRKKLGGKTKFFCKEFQSLEFCWKEENFLLFLKTQIRSWLCLVPKLKCSVLILLEDGSIKNRWSTYTVCHIVTTTVMISVWKKRSKFAGLLLHFKESRP